MIHYMCCNYINPEDTFLGDFFDYIIFIFLFGVVFILILEIVVLCYPITCASYCH